MAKIYDFYADSGHGWLKVPRAEVEQLGILNKISHFSYQRGEYVYLEEDCDASAFVMALNAKGIKFASRGHHTNRQSKIRSYQQFRSTATVA